MRIAAGSALIFLLCATRAAANPSTPADQPRLDAARMETLVSEQISLVRKGKLREAQRSLDRKIAMQKTPLDRADLLEAFGVQLYDATPTLEQRNLLEAALDYLARAAMAYRMLLGNDHPDFATALVRQAEMERLLQPEEPSLSTDVAYETAYRIRAARLGANALATLSLLVPMAQLKALPSRANGDPDKIEGAAGLLHQVLDATSGSLDPQASALHVEAVQALQTLDAQHGGGLTGGRRPRILAAGVTAACRETSMDDVMAFSGEASALQVVRDRFAKARLKLRPCGAALLFPFTPGVDPSPVLDLLTDISAGRMKGVRMDLINGTSTGGRPAPGGSN